MCVFTPRQYGSSSFYVALFIATMPRRDTVNILNTLTTLPNNNGETTRTVSVLLCHMLTSTQKITLLTIFIETNSFLSHILKLSKFEVFILCEFCWSTFTSTLHTHDYSIVGLMLYW